MIFKIDNFQNMSKFLIFFVAIFFVSCINKSDSLTPVRERISINKGWSFFKYELESDTDDLIYDVRPELIEYNLVKEADSKPTEALDVETEQTVLKPWILPTANNFIKNPNQKHIRPEGNPGGDFPFVQANYDDSAWENINLPHDWAIKEPFQTGWDSEIGGGMGRLPVNGVAWYRRKLNISTSDVGRSVFLDMDGTMSYAMVWCNGELVGGWPFGYASWRLNLTPYLKYGEVNQLAIRLDNPNYSARWYPGGGIYRNVWLTKTNPVHIAQYGTYLTTKNSSEKSATVNLEVNIDNDSQSDVTVEISTEVYVLSDEGSKTGKPVAKFSPLTASVVAGESFKVKSSVKIKNPKLWGPPPTQQPNLYVAETKVLKGGKQIDLYKTQFGIRSLKFDADKGIFINGERIQIKGVNNHHDLGALGTAFNTRAAERQLEILREMGCNAIRMAHNPPAPELLELTDKMGFLVMDEIFDSWEQKKTPYDFHLIFDDWSEPDTRAFVRRDRNCPSVIIWSFGNEVGEQYTGQAGAEVAQRLCDIVNEEDETRPTILAMNFAKPFMELPKIPDMIGLNYQGEGIRQDPMFEGTDRIRTKPQYDEFHEKFPDKVILSTETASAFSSRGVYLFPVTKAISAPVRDGSGGNSKILQVSSYELHAVDFGSSADKVFQSVDRHSFVAGEFVWTGWDYLGEPTPYYQARSSYTGIIDLAGFKKDRYYLYQSHWRPNFPVVHILPHWNWPGRLGKNTPVHVFTSGDEVELFLNGKSLGKKKKTAYEYRLRWDDVVYEPGVIKAVVYKNSEKWAEEEIKTTGSAVLLKAEADRHEIKADGKDLAFITVQVTDSDGLLVPNADNLIRFSIDGPGEIVATDNGNPADMRAFSSIERNAFSGLCLVIVKGKPGDSGTIQLTVESDNLQSYTTPIYTKE